MRLFAAFAEFSLAFKKLHPHILTAFLFYATSSYFIVALKLFNRQRLAGFPEQSFQSLVLLKAVFFPFCLFISFLVNFSDDTVLLSLNGPQSDHGCALKSSTKQCDDCCVQIVDTYKYLGSPEAELF